MKRLTAALSLAILTAAAGPAAAGEELFIYNWSDYTAPEILAKFEQETGIKVTLDVYDSNETLLAKLKAGNAAYDIVVPSHNFVPILIKDGLLQPIDAPKLGNYANIDDRWRNPEWDPGNRYTVPWMWGTTSFAVDTAVYKGPTDSAALLFTSAAGTARQHRHVQNPGRGDRRCRHRPRPAPVRRRPQGPEKGRRPARRPETGGEDLQF